MGPFRLKSHMTRIILVIILVNLVIFTNGKELGKRQKEINIRHMLNKEPKLNENLPIGKIIFHRFPVFMTRTKAHMQNQIF